jgi:hypothetical protein
VALLLVGFGGAMLVGGAAIGFECVGGTAEAGIFGAGLGDAGRALSDDDLLETIVLARVGVVDGGGGARVTGTELLRTGSFERWIRGDARGAMNGRRF